MILKERRKEIEKWLDRSSGMLAMTRSMYIIKPMGRKVNMTIQVYLPEGTKQRDELKAYAKMKGQSVSEMLLECYKLIKEKESK